MFFVLSKIFWIVARPTNLVMILLVLGIALVFWGSYAVRDARRQGRKYSKRRRWGWGLVLSAVTLSFVGQFTSLPQIGLSALEDRFPRSEIPQNFEGIVILGGAVSADEIAASRETIIFNGSAERATDALTLAHRYPHIKIVFSGFSGLLNPVGLSEAEQTRDFFLQNGIAADRLIIEDKSRNTYENAVNTVAIIGDRPSERWLLVTSAWHMSRAMGCFAQSGWVPRPYPTDYRTQVGPPLEIRLTNTSFSALNTLFHELVGLVVYWLTDKIPVLFPSLENLNGPLAEPDLTD